VVVLDDQPEIRADPAGPAWMAERPVVPARQGNACGGKGPHFQASERRVDSRRLAMSLLPPAKVGKLQAALHTKAKESPSYRFYALYDKVYRADVLAHAYERCRANGGAAGVDGQTFADIEAYGEARWLGELAQDLRGQTYHPQAVRRVWIPKADGKQRPLGIPTIKDRVVQMAAVLVLEPIFEADLLPEQFAYRAGRSATEAVRAVQTLLEQGYTEVVDADLSGYFDSIPHAELLKSVARRVSDRHLLHLLKMWLEAPVEETDAQGRVQRTTRNKDEGRGTPQGGVASPLLANLYMRRFLLGWKRLGHEQRLEARIVNYADDFVILTRGHAEEALAAMRDMMAKLQLTVNERKTRLCSLPEETFTFLGFTFGRQISWRTGRAYVAPAPAAGKVRGIGKKIRQATSGRTVWRSVAEQVAQLNALLLGWANYFRIGYVTAAWRVVQQHACRRLRRWMRRKHKAKRGRGQQYPDMQLYERWGLVNLVRSVRRLPLWANV
jgi:RNA-directed DNA polymerase